MITKLYKTLCQRFPNFKKRSRKLMYQFMAGYYRESDWTLMNYGYAPLGSENKMMELDEDDEPDGNFQPATKGESDPGWICMISAEK